MGEDVVMGSLKIIVFFTDFAQANYAEGKQKNLDKIEKMLEENNVEVNLEGELKEKQKKRLKKEEAEIRFARKRGGNHVSYCLAQSYDLKYHSR